MKPKTVHFIGKKYLREFNQAYTANGKRQTSDSSWEFFKIENEQIKAAQNVSYG